MHCTCINKHSRSQFIPAIFSHTGQMCREMKRTIRDQIRLQLTIAERVGKTSRVDSISDDGLSVFPRLYAGRLVGIFFFLQQELGRQLTLTDDLFHRTLIITKRILYVFLSMSVKTLMTTPTTC